MLQFSWNLSRKVHPKRMPRKISPSYGNHFWKLTGLISKLNFCCYTLNGTFSLLAYFEVLKFKCSKKKSFRPLKGEVNWRSCLTLACEMFILFIFAFHPKFIALAFRLVTWFSKSCGKNFFVCTLLRIWHFNNLFQCFPYFFSALSIDSWWMVKRAG